VLADSPAKFPSSGLRTKPWERIPYSQISVINYRQLDDNFLHGILKTPKRWRYPQTTSRGLRISLFCRPVDSPQSLQYIAWTFCMHRENLICIYLSRNHGEDLRYRAAAAWVETRPAVTLKSFQLMELYLEDWSFDKLNIPKPQISLLSFFDATIELVHEKPDVELSIVASDPQWSLFKGKRDIPIMNLASGLHFAIVVTGQRRERPDLGFRALVLAGASPLPAEVWCHVILAEHSSALDHFIHWLEHYKSLEPLLDRSALLVPDNGVVTVAYKKRTTGLTLVIALRYSESEAVAVEEDTIVRSFYDLQIKKTADRVI
jgi:hypothetical protein